MVGDLVPLNDGKRWLIVHPPIGRKNTTYSPCRTWEVICYQAHRLGEPETTLECLFTATNITKKKTRRKRGTISDHDFRFSFWLFQGDVFFFVLLFFSHPTPLKGNSIISEYVYMGVSKNNGTPKWMVHNGKPY